jgi:hypothetical protein
MLPLPDPVWTLPSFPSITSEEDMDTLNEEVMSGFEEALAGLDEALGEFNAALWDLESASRNRLTKDQVDSNK